MEKQASVQRLVGYTAAIASCIWLGSGGMITPDVASALVGIASGPLSEQVDNLGVRLINRLRGQQPQQYNALVDAIGKAIAKVVRSSAQDYKNERRQIEALAREAETSWVRIAQRESASEPLQALQIGGPVKVLSRDERDRIVLEEAEWSDFLYSLRTVGPISLQAETHREISIRLHKNFESALRSVLLDNFAGNSRAFSEILLNMLLEVRLKLQQLQIQTPIDWQEAFDYFEEKLKANGEQIESLSSILSERIESDLHQVNSSLEDVRKEIVSCESNITSQIDKLNIKISSLIVEGESQYESLESSQRTSTRLRIEHLQRQLKKKTLQFTAASKAASKEVNQVTLSEYLSLVEEFQVEIKDIESELINLENGRS